MTALGFCLCLHASIVVMSVGTCTVAVWQGLSVGQGNGSHDGLGSLLPKHSQFHVSFIKTLIPRLITYLALVKFYHMKQCQVFFIREWCTSSEKKKKKPNNFQEPCWGFQIVASAQNLIFPQIFIPSKCTNPYALSSFPLTVFIVVLE